MAQNPAISLRLETRCTLELHYKLALSKYDTHAQGFHD
jgi:hypothetical protein